MTSSLQAAEGIILSTLKFRDYDLILNVFTKEMGLVKFIAKKHLRSKVKKGASLDPLTKTEIIYQSGKSSLAVVKEMTYLSSFLELRKNLAHLTSACALLKDIQHALFEHKPVPQLYDLVLTYLDQLPHFPHSGVFLTSFRLKVLRHEGLYPFPPACSVCHQMLTEAYYQHALAYCHLHAPNKDTVLKTNEIILIEQLAYCRSFQELQQMHIEKPLFDLIEEIFHQAFK